MTCYPITNMTAIKLNKLITDLKIKVVESVKDAENDPILNDDEISDDDDSEITEEK